MSWLRKNAWVLFFIIGLALLGFAVDNIVFIPRLNGDDPNRGWAWLTTDEEVLDYIKFWFRNFGLWVLAVAVFVLMISATGFRKGEKWAYFTLLYLPVHIIIHLLIFPWLAPPLLVILLVTIAGLALPFRQFFPKT